MKKFWKTFAGIFGLNKNSKYVKNYLNEANMRSGIFMSAIIVVLGHRMGILGCSTAEMKMSLGF